MKIFSLTSSRISLKETIYSWIPSNLQPRVKYSHILGNLHSLYNISKDLAYTLNGSNQLVLLLNEFEAWKKFLMNDLNKY